MCFKQSIEGFFFVLDETTVKDADLFSSVKLYGLNSGGGLCCNNIQETHIVPMNCFVLHVQNVPGNRNIEYKV